MRSSLVAWNACMNKVVNSIGTDTRIASLHIPSHQAALIKYNEWNDCYDEHAP
jgi:hypothetical protein